MNIENVVYELSKIPELKWCKKEDLIESVKTLISKCTSKMYSKGIMYELVPLPNDYYYPKTEFGDPNEDWIEFNYNGNSYEIPTKNIVEKDDKSKWFEIKTEILICPLCFNEVEKITIGNRIVKGGVSFYRNQEMCIQCSNKQWKE